MRCIPPKLWAFLIYKVITDFQQIGQIGVGGNTMA